MKVTYYAASSLDGYIAKKGGDVSWLDALNIPPGESGYEEFFATVDALVMGRGTYDMIQSFGCWPYGDKPTWVCTGRELTTLEGVSLQNESEPLAVVEAARAMGIKHLWLVGGGRLAAAFLEQGLLTDISISQMPVILGEGIKLFAEMESSHFLRLRQSTPNKHGFVQIEYDVSTLN